MSLFDDLDLGAGDYAKEKDFGFSQFTAKPNTQKPYQPFGGQLQQPRQEYIQESPLPEFEPEPVIGGGYESPFDEDLDVYEQAKKQYSYLSRDATAHNASAKLYEDRYEEFKKNKFLPFYKQFDEFSDFETDDEYANSLDSLYESDLKASQAEDGFFGESESKKLAKARLGKYAGWNQPNGLRDQYLRLKQEKESRRALAEQANAQKTLLMENLTSIPTQTRMAMDEALRSRGGSAKSKRSMDEMLDQFEWETPVVDMNTGEVTNLDRVDPRRKLKSVPDFNTGKQSKSYEVQRQRLASAMQGDIKSVIAKRDLTAKERTLRDKGVIFSQKGVIDGRPLGLSRQDVDLLDIEEMKKAGVKSYKGKPLEEVLNQLGGQERLEMAKVMQAVYAAKSNFEDVQLEYLKVAGGKRAEAAKKKMEEAREAVNKTIGLAAQYGLDNELFEQAETTGWFAGIGNAIKRGLLMSDMSDYTPDFVTNTLDADEIQKFIDIASDIEKLPESSAMARYKKAENKSNDFAGAVGKLLFNNTDAIPELFVESLASFLPATFKWGLAAAGVGSVGGAINGFKRGPKGFVAGGLAGASLGARSGWAIASFNLETSGTVLEGMQELGIDWKNPKIFAAAWDNEITRNAIVKRAVKKGIPIALMDGLSAGLAGKMSGLRDLGLNGGKLIDGASWSQNLKYASKAAPRFTKWQRTANVATEIGADSAFGTMGEYFGQAWSKEPGEEWDWDAMAAEGIIGVGPGIAGGFLEQSRSFSNDFTDAPIQYSDQRTTPDGTSGTINRAGFKTPYQTYNSADGMTSGILNMAGIDAGNMNDPENATKVMAVQDWISNMWISDPQSMENLKIVVADRTPFADLNNEGSFEVDDDGNGVIYMNRSKLSQDPIGAFMHEAGHMARLSLFPNNEELMDVYNSLSSDEKLSAFAEYYKKIPGKKITQYDENQQAEIKKAYRKFIKQKGEIGAADEWFSFQFVRLLAGGQVDKSVKSDMQGWLKKFALPFLQKYAGSENLAGSKKDILYARILSYMGRTPRGFDSAVNPNLQAPDMPGTETDFSTPGVRAPKGANILAGLSDSEGLNHLITRITEEFTTPEEQARAADALNTFLDKNVLPKNISFWTQRERQTAANVQAESQKGPLEDRTFGESLPQEMRALDELLARGRVEQMTEADFAEPEVTEFAEETDPKKKREAEAARRKRQGSKKDSTKYPEGFDQNDTGARVGRSPRNVAREKEQFNILGKRFRVTLTMPGFRGDESRVEYFATRKEAEAAVQEFEEKENTKRIKRIKGKHTKALSIIKDPAKFEEAYNKAAEKLGKDSSIHARIAEALGLSGIMSESLFGSSYSSKHLGEGKVHGGGVKGAVKAPSMREVQSDLFLSDQEHQDAVEQLTNREAELVRQIAELEKIQGPKESTEQATKKEESKDTYSKVQVVQLRRNKKGQYELYSLGKGNKIKKVKNAAQTKKLLPFLRKLNETSQIEKGALDKVKNFKDNFEKQAGDFKGQLRYWLMTKKKGPSKKTETKKAPKKKEKQPSEIEAELNDIKKTLKLVRDYREVLVPESKAFMWGDLPHPSFFVDKEGTERIKLSVLAKASKSITVYEKRNNKLQKKNLSNPQASLADFAKSYDGSKRKDFGFLKGTGLKPEEYALHVDSIMAAALNPRDLQYKPMSEMSIDKDGNEKIKEYFGGFQVDKGTNYFLYAATKAMELETSKGNFVPLVSENPTLDELAMYEVAQGKAYEDNGGEYTGRNFYRYFSLIERMAKEADRKIRTLSKEYEKLDPKDPSRQGVMQSIKNLTDYKKKLYPSVDDIANYAEENQYFPKVQGGKMFSEAFSEWLYYDEMLKAIGSDIDSQPPDPGKKSYFDYVEGDLDAGQSSIKEHLLIRKEQYEKALARSDEERQKVKKTQKPLFSREFPNLDLGPNEAESDFETNKDVFYVSPDGVAGNTLRAKGFDFRDIGEDPDDDIAPREGVHGGFKRRVVDQGFDIMAVLRAISQDNVKGPLQERLKSLVPSTYDTAFLTEFIKPENKTRITVEYNGKDIKAEWRDDPAKPEGGYWVTGIMAPNQKPETNPGFLQAINDTWMTQIDQEFLKPTSDSEMVTAAQIADFLYRGKSASDLGLIPSSKNKQDMTGAPGSGLLPFVFEAFIKDMYQKLNITDFETEVTVSEFIEPLASDKREFERDGKKVRLEVDANGRAVLYDVAEDRSLNITKKELSELTQTHFGKDAKAVAKDLKSEPEAEGQKAEVVGKKYKYIEDAKAKDFEKWKNDAYATQDYIAASEDIDDSYSISREEYSDYLKDLIDNGFGYEIDKRNNDPMGTEAMKESDRWAETNKKSSAKKTETKNQKPKAEGQRQYTKVKLKYNAGKWFVNREPVDRSLFAESAKHPEFDYMQAALAPIVQAVIDARRVDIFGTSKRKENLIVPRDTQRAENESSDLIDEDAPEGVLDNTEKETDTSKDQAKTVQGENEEAAASENPRGDENAPLPQSTSTQADAFASKLSGTDTNKRLFNLKKGRKQALDLLFVVEQFKNDPVLWEAFDMPTPKMNVMDAKPFDSYIKDLKKHPNYPAFEARILSPGTQALGASFGNKSGKPEIKGVNNIQSSDREEASKPVIERAENVLEKTFNLIRNNKNQRLPRVLEALVLDLRKAEKELGKSIYLGQGVNKEYTDATGLDKESIDYFSYLAMALSKEAKSNPVVANVAVNFGNDPNFFGRYINSKEGDLNDLAKELGFKVREGDTGMLLMSEDFINPARNSSIDYLTPHQFARSLLHESIHAIGDGFLNMFDKEAIIRARAAGKELSIYATPRAKENETVSIGQAIAENGKDITIDSEMVKGWQKFVIPYQKNRAKTKRQKERAEAVDNLTTMYLDLVDMYNNPSKYGLADNERVKHGYYLYSPAELLTEAIADKEVQEILTKIKVSPEQAKRYGNLFTNKDGNFFDHIVAIIRTFFGLDARGTALEGVIRAQTLINDSVNPLPDGTIPDFTDINERSALGSSYALSSSIPDNFGKLSMLSKLAAKAGVTEEDKEKYKKIFKNFDAMTALVDQADPPKRLVADFLKSVGIKDQALIDAIDVHGKWHQYYGKGMNTVEQSQVQFIEPIKDAMAKHGLENEVFGEYLLARAAPSRNLHLREMYEAELKDLEKDSSEYKSLKKMLDERGDSLSGINTQDAIDRIKEMEAMDAVKNFIADESNPLQLFYDMNREALQFKSESELIRSEGDINEMKAMITAMSKYDINNISNARMRDNYNYAPMQGFEGETEKLFDNERAYEAVGKSSTSSGRGFDQPKHTFLETGAFGRTNTNVGPDPETVFAAAQEQYFDAAIRSHKNEVSNAFGLLFETMKAIAYPKDESSIELTPELKNLSPEIREKVKAEFDQIFQKEFKALDVKKDYEINQKQVQVDGKDVAGLKMVRREISKTFQNDPLVFVYRKNGEPHLISFKDNDQGARLAASLKNLRYESLPRILQFANRMTRFMARMFTSMNPAFIIPNFIRDLGTAAIHLSEDDKKNMVGKTLNGKRLGKFMKAIFKAEQAISKGEGLGFEGTLDIQSAQELLREGDHVKMYQFAKAAGAKIGMFRHKSIPELINDLRKNKAKSKKGAMARLRSTGQVIESMNTAVENSIRMSAFWSAIETGRSVSQAASISRNVTVDFNQKGNLTQAFGSLFVFFGASMNSAHRFARTLHKRGPKESGYLIGGILAASFAVNLFNRLIDDDEDEEMPDYDTITSFKRDTNLLLPLPGNIPGLEDKTGRDTGYFGIPLPLGYNVFWALGQTSADFFAKYVMGRGGSGSMDFITRNLDATMNAFNPIGGATLATAVVPTAGKPIVEMYANKNFMGSEIRKSDLPYETPKPAHMMDQKRTQKHFTDLSKFINEVMGGDDDIKGTIGGLFGGNPLLSSKDSDYQFDLSGSEMEHLALGYLGGPGQIANMFFGDGIYPMMDEKEYDLEINRMPIVNRFIRTSTYGTATRRTYYQIREAAMTAKAAVESAKKINSEAFNLAQEKHKPLIQIMSSIKTMDGKRSKIRDMKKKIENSKNLTNSQRMQRIEELERKELNMITGVIKKAQSLGIK